MILAVLQARMSSTRLPGKVMADVAGAPMILRQIERLKRARRLDRIAVATSTDPSDDGLAAMLVLHDVLVHRGPQQGLGAHHLHVQPLGVGAMGWRVGGVVEATRR